VAGTALFALLSACSSDAPTAVFDPNAPARLALDAQVRFQTTGTAALRVNARYPRLDQTLVTLDTLSVALTDATTQQVPLSINLAACLGDAQRAGVGGAAPAADECIVQLELALLTNGQVVDRNTVRNLSVRPGQTTTVTTPVVLEEVGSIRLTVPPANVVSPGAPLRLEARSSLTLAALVIDGADRPIARPVTWSSANISVATVSSAGVVTGVTAGTTRITATSGTRSTAVDVRVVPVPQPITITAALGSSGTATVTSAPAGISCNISAATTEGACSANFPGDASVSLTVRTGGVTTFVGWGGDCTGTAGCTLETSQPRTASVSLRAFRTLSVSASGAGNGAITAPGGIINCVWRNGSASSGPCTASLPEGAQITLTASPEANSQFTGWSGDCATATGSSCSLTMNADRNAVAQFRAVTTYRITAGTGTGTGVVTSSPAGMNCTVTATTVSGTCTLAVPAGTSASLIATGTTGSSWRAWDGICASAGATCSVIAPLLPGEFPLRVHFERTATLTIVPDSRSTGVGRVLLPGGVICSTTGATTTSGVCSVSYPLGTSVTFDAATSGLNDFVGWNGACANFFREGCTLTMNGNLTAVVRFDTVSTINLETSIEGDPGSLQVTQTRYGIAHVCQRTTNDSTATVCNFRVASDQPVTITKLISPGLIGFFLNGSICYDAPDPCITTLSQDSQAAMYVYTQSVAVRPPMLRRRVVKPPAK
jgi:hypothetical protein